MRVLIVAAGSMGDVAPFGGLAARFHESGHEVDIATHERFAQVARASGAGFRLLRGDAAVLMGQAEAGDGDDDTPTFEPGAASLPRNVKLAASVTRDFAHHVADAIHDGGADVLVLSTTVAPFAWHVAESMGIPTVGAYIELLHPSRDLPPAITSRPLGPLGNRAAARAREVVIDTWISRATRELRAELGLPPLSPGAMRRRLETERWPVCYGFSPAVVPRPADWREGLHVVGYWWPQHLADWQPPRELVDFLEAGPPPVFVGFGSMGRSHSEQLNEVIPDALRRAGVRAVVQAGWAGLSAADDAGGDTITVDGEVSYDWLMPRVAAVVHHAGAGTTAAALRAGVPSVPVPIGFDNPFWAARLDALGVSPGQVPLKRLSADNLAAAVRQVVSEPSYRRRAGDLAQQIKTEDGAGRVLEIVQGLATRAAS